MTKDEKDEKDEKDNKSLPGSVRLGLFFDRHGQAIVGWGGVRGEGTSRKINGYIVRYIVDRVKTAKQ